MTEKQEVQKAASSVKAPSWPLIFRIGWLRRLESIIETRKDEILSAVAKDNGCSEFRVLTNEYVPVRQIIKHYVNKGGKFLGKEGRSKFLSFLWASKKVTVEKEPIGTVGIISPSNYPFSLTIVPVLSAIFAGNAVVLKPSDSPNTNRVIKSIIRESLKGQGVDPDTVFRMLPSDIEYGKELVKCPDIDKIHFTGSVSAGWWVNKENARVRLTPPTLELGGSNPGIVLDDADLEEAAKVIVWGRFGGMSCNNIKRVFAVESVYDKLVDLIRDEARTLSPHEYEQNYSRKAKKDYVNFLKDRYIFPEFEDINITPVVVDIGKVENPEEEDILVEETFVPILPVIKVESLNHAVQMANNSRFGLGASVFTANKERFENVADKLNVGVVNHNDAMTEFAIPRVPFGGWKDSGYGYSHGKEGLMEFVRLKTKVRERFSAPKMQLFPWTEEKMETFRNWIDTLLDFS